MSNVKSNAYPNQTQLANMLYQVYLQDTTKEKNTNLTKKGVYQLAEQKIQSYKQQAKGSLQNLENSLQFFQAADINNSLNKGIESDLAEISTALQSSEASLNDQQTLQKLSSSVKTINNLSNKLIELGPVTNANQTTAKLTTDELGSQLTGTATVIFNTLPSATSNNNLPILAAMLMCTIAMTDAMSIYVNYSQQQMVQMNKLQEIVQDMVNFVLSFSSKMQQVYNQLITQVQAYNNLANSAGLNGAAANSPNDMYLINNQKTANDYMAQGNNLFPQPSSNGGKDPTYAPNQYWNNVGLMSPLGGLCLSNSNVAFLDIPDSVNLNGPYTGTAPNQQSPLDAYMNSNAEASGNTGIPASNTATGISSTGVNLAFLVTPSSGNSVTGGFSIPEDIFNLIPNNYIYSQNTTNSSSPLATTVTGDPTSPSKPYDPTYSSKQNPISTSSGPVGYLTVGAIADLCQNVLTIAGTYLPTGGYGSEFGGLFGGTTSSTTSNTAQPVSIHSMASMVESLSQVPNNLNPAITTFQQQVQSVVQSVTQIFQLLNQMIPNLTMR